MKQLFCWVCILFLSVGLGCSSPVTDEEQTPPGRDAGPPPTSPPNPTGGRAVMAGQPASGGIDMAGAMSRGGESGAGGDIGGMDAMMGGTPDPGPFGEAVGNACNEAADCPPGTLDIGMCLTGRYPSGYCSAACVQDADCPDGGACVGRFCMATCEENDGCRSGYRCDAAYDAGPKVCVPGSSDLKDAAEICEQSSECRGSIIDQVCATRGEEAKYCTATCYIDDDCPSGNICSIGDGPEGYCIRACENSMQCPADFACYDYIELLTRRSGSTVRMSRAGCYPIASGDGQIASPCIGRADCEGGRRGVCAYQDDGGYCTQLCNADNGCPPGARCAFVNPDNGEGYCMDSCEANDTCGAGQACSRDNLAGDALCIPAGIGNGMPGSPCNTVADCGGGGLGRCVANGNSEAKKCQRQCSFKNPCPANHRCSQLNDLEVGLCTKICIPGEAGECPEGSACFDTDGDGTTECFEAEYSSFNRGIGQICQARDQCSDGLICSDYDARTERGQCTKACRSTDDCGQGAHCNGVTETVPEGICQKTCMTDTDCDAGSECLDLFGNDGVKECVISAIGTGRIGDPCDARDDCGGGSVGLCIQSNNWTERGYCSQRACTADTGCPSHSHCGYIDEETNLGLCLADCDQNGRCDYGLTCSDPDGDGQKECVAQSSGSTPAGGGCRSARDCSTSICLTNGYPRGMCSDECTRTVDCPEGTHCEVYSTTPRRGICLPDCEVDGDCRADYRCAEQYTRGLKTCVGRGYGQSGVGEPCRSSTDCAIGTDAACLGLAGWINGYCLVSGCTPEMGCAEGKHCGFYNRYRDSGGYCVQSCIRDDDCPRADYGCRDFDGDGQQECAPIRSESTGMDTCAGVQYCLSQCENPFDGACNNACFSASTPDAVRAYDAMIACQTAAQCSPENHACRLAACADERTVCFGDSALPMGNSSCQTYETCVRRCGDDDAECSVQCLRDTSAEAYNAYREAIDCNRYRGSAFCDEQIMACTR